MERIQINGEWYVRESTIPNQDVDLYEMLEDMGIHEYNVCMYEDDEVYIKCHYHANPPSIHYTPTIEFLDKKTKGVDGKVDYWDATTWMWGIYNNNPESTLCLKEEGLGKYIPRIRAFIKYMIDNNILRKD
jgi:hypothetical protein